MVNCQLNCCFSRYFASIVNHLSYLSLKIENLSIDLTSGAAMPRHRASPCGSGATERRRCWGMIKRKYQWAPFCLDMFRKFRSWMVRFFEFLLVPWTFFYTLIHPGRSCISRDSLMLGEAWYPLISPHWSKGSCWFSGINPFRVSPKNHQIWG